MRDWDRAEDVSRRQASLGSPCFVFAHSFDTAEGKRIVYLHPQMMADARQPQKSARCFSRTGSNGQPDDRSPYSVAQSFGGNEYALTQLGDELLKSEKLRKRFANTYEVFDRLRKT